jgi:hypothetical protein
VERTVLALHTSHDSGAFAYAYAKSINTVKDQSPCFMPEVIEIPIELTRFQLPQAVQARLQFLLDCQDEGNILSHAEQQEAEGLVELAEFLSLLHLRSARAMKQA